MKCENCGAEISNQEDAFCVNCGVALSGKPLEASPAEPMLTTPVTQFNPELSVPAQTSQGGPGVQATQVPKTAEMVQPASVYQQRPQTAQSVQGGNAHPARSSHMTAVIVAMAAVIVILAAVVVILVVKPFGSGQGESADRQAVRQTTVTMNPSSASSSESSSASSSESASSQANAEANPAPAQQEPEVAPAPAPATDPEATHGLQANQQPSAANTPFWGAWIGAFSVYENATNYVADAKSKGLPAIMYESTDWENLNPTHYWVVSIGSSATQAEAQQWCDKARAAGFSDAYVKYSGNHR